MFELGRTLKPHGLKGEVAIKLDVDVPSTMPLWTWCGWSDKDAWFPTHSIHRHPSQTTVVQFDGV